MDVSDYAGQRPGVFVAEGSIWDVPCDVAPARPGERCPASEPHQERRQLVRTCHDPEAIEACGAAGVAYAPAEDLERGWRGRLECSRTRYCQSATGSVRSSHQIMS